MTHLEGLLREHGARWEGTDEHGPRRFDRVTFNDSAACADDEWDRYGRGGGGDGSGDRALCSRAPSSTTAAPARTARISCSVMSSSERRASRTTTGGSGRVGAFEHHAARLFADGEEREVDAFPTGTALLAVAESVAGLGSGSAMPWPEARGLGRAASRAARLLRPRRVPRTASRRMPMLSAPSMRGTRTLCEDMEAAAIAQICALHDLPFLTVKDISNNEFHALSTFGEAGTFKMLEAELGKRAAAFLFALLERLAAMPDASAVAV